MLRSPSPGQSTDMTTNNPSPHPLIPTILCGGVGSRLWPVSREMHPKPFIRMQDGQSLLQKAFLRGATLPGMKEVLTVTNRDLYFKMEDEYGEVNQSKVPTSFILEPVGRNTAPAIAVAALMMQEKYGPDAQLLILAADHLISNQQAFAEAVTKASELAAQGRIVTFGISPTGPETGYGYIEADDNDVIRFVEKPDFETAQEYLASGNFLWNSGMFCFAVGTMLREMEHVCPDILSSTKACMEASRRAEGEGFTQLELNADTFAKVPDDSVDYAVMEKTKLAAVVPCNIGWSDIGCWKSLGELTPADGNNNHINGDALVLDSHNCTIRSDGRMVAIVGMEDTVIIDTPDALLVANKYRAQEVKAIYAQLKADDHETHKVHRTAYRPWGSYTVLEEGPGFKIKRIEVKPGGKLSLQMHHHRSEHWVVVQGTALVINGDKELELKDNESTFIPATHKHRLENAGNELLVLIEVQTGSYLGEDDIVRFQDVYGRVG